MSLFGSVDHHYARYCPRLPDQVVRLLAHETAGAEAPRLLDLGAGTGQVALSVLPVVPPTARLDLVDQDQDMLRTALDELRPHLGERTATVHAIPATCSRAATVSATPRYCCPAVQEWCTRRACGTSRPDTSTPTRRWSKPSSGRPARKRAYPSRRRT
ncbi:class I SAM-dependent methyltransferase [Streptomyces sp. NBC_01367]